MKIKFQKYSLHSMQSFQGRFAQHSLFKYLGNCSALIKIIFSTSTSEATLRPER